MQKIKKKLKMAKTKKKTLEWLIKNYSLFFAEFGIQENEIIKRFEEYKENQSESVEDFLWSLFNHLLLENGKQSENLIQFYKDNHRIYLEMAFFRRKFEKVPANYLWKLVIENRINLDLEQSASSNLEFEFIVHNCQDCDACQAIQGKLISIEEAVKNKIIPYEKCTREKGCACGMSLSPRRDIEGFLIRK